MSREEEAALCAWYEERRDLMEGAETLLGTDWPEGPRTEDGWRW